MLSLHINRTETKTLAIVIAPRYHLLAIFLFKWEQHGVWRSYQCKSHSHQEAKGGFQPRSLERRTQATLDMYCPWVLSCRSMEAGCLGSEEHLCVVVENLEGRLLVSEMGDVTGIWGPDSAVGARRKRWEKSTELSPGSAGSQRTPVAPSWPFSSLQELEGVTKLQTSWVPWGIHGSPLGRFKQADSSAGSCQEARCAFWKSWSLLQSWVHIWCLLLESHCLRTIWTDGIKKPSSLIFPPVPIDDMTEGWNNRNNISFIEPFLRSSHALGASLLALSSSPRKTVLSMLELEDEPKEPRLVR